MYNYSFYQFWQGAEIREPIDDAVVKKVKELHHIGVKTVSEVQRHLESYVKNEMFRGEDTPSLARRRFYPTANDIRNILNTQRLGNRHAPDDQENLVFFCEEWKKAKPLDSIFYRVIISSSLSLYKEQLKVLQEITKLFCVCFIPTAKMSVYT